MDELPKTTNRLSLLIFIVGPLFALLAVFILIIFGNYSTVVEFDLDIFDFDSCAAKGYPIMESFPRQCRTNDGRLFVEVIYTNA